MLRSLSASLTLATCMTLTPVPGLADQVLADASGSQSRAATRHDLAKDADNGEVVARSKSRRATRGSGTNAEENETFVQNRGKRTRRNLGAQTADQPVVAATETADTDLIAFARQNPASLTARIEARDFSGPTGALALYQLTGKALAKITLSRVETAALTELMETADIPDLVRDAEARLIGAAGRDSLNDLAEALGIPRPDVGADTPNLGARLQVDSPVSPG